MDSRDDALPRRSRRVPPPTGRRDTLVPSSARTVPLWSAPVIAIAALLVGVAIGSSGGKGGTGSAAGPAQVTLLRTATKTTAAAAKKVVLHQAGNGIKNTPSFTTGADWSVSYTFNCAAFGDKGNFSITDGAQLAAVLVSALDTKGADTTYQHDDAGKHYLEIDSECSWSVTVTDGDDG